MACIVLLAKVTFFELVLLIKNLIIIIFDFHFL